MQFATILKKSWYIFDVLVKSKNAVSKKYLPLLVISA